MGKSDLRCAACTIFGGITIEGGENERQRRRSAAQAHNLSALVLEETGVQREISPGDHVELEPCVPQPMLDRIREMRGRPCPRPAEHIESMTAVALEGVFLTLAERTQPLLPSWLAYNVHPTERASVMRRMSRALTDSEVIEELRPKPEKAG